MEPATATYTDAHDRQWNLTLDINALRAIRDELKIDLLNLHRDHETLERLADDPILLVDLLSVLLTDQIRAARIDARQFASGLRGRHLEEALAALMDAIVDFSPPAKGQAIREIWMKARDVNEKGLAHLQSLIRKRAGNIEETIIDQMTKEFDQQIDMISGSSSGNGAESPESPIPDHTRSDKST